MSTVTLTRKISFVDAYPLDRPTVMSALAEKVSAGTTDYADEAVLFPHEALRMEMLRVQRTLPYFNPERCPWKANYLQSWVDNFFAPIVRQQFDTSKNIYYDAYLKNGSSLSSERSKECEKLLQLLDHFAASVSVIARLGDVLRHSHDTSAKDHLHDDTDKLRKSFSDLERSLLKVMILDEEFWPVEIRERGVVRHILLPALLIFNSSTLFSSHDYSPEQS
jgi:hypothetical protein